MLIVNFSHPLSAEHLAAIERASAQRVDSVRDVPVHFDDAAPYGPQAEALVAQVGLTSVEWQTWPLMLVLPGHSFIAAALLAVLHGRTGHFPAAVRLRRAAGPVVQFFVAEIVSLQDVREESRRQRAG